MGLVDTLNRLNQRFAWSLLGFLLAALFGSVTVYLEFIRDSRPDVQYDLITDASVLDVREELGDLQILYDGMDIKSAAQSLRVLVIRISNRGLEDILKGFYDDKDPLGARVSGGSVLRAELLRTSSEYLTSTLDIVRQDDSTVLFSPTILETGEFFDVKLLLLHSDSQQPVVQPIGKIARVRTLTLVDASRPSGPSFLVRVFAGDVWVQLLRLGGYSVALIALIVGVAMPISGMQSAVRNLKSRRTNHRYCAALGTQMSDADERIVKVHQQQGIHILRWIQHVTSSDAQLSQFLEAVDQAKRHFPKDTEGRVMSIPIDVGDLTLPAHYAIKMADTLHGSGFTREIHDEIEVDRGMKGALDRFLIFADSGQLPVVLLPSE